MSTSCRRGGSGSRREGKTRGWFMFFQTCSSVNLSDAEVSASAELLSVDLRLHSQLRRSILGAGRPNADGCLIELETREKGTGVQSTYPTQSFYL
jgi:hypothetical protein